MHIATPHLRDRRVQLGGVLLLLGAGAVAVLIALSTGPLDRGADRERGREEVQGPVVPADQLQWQYLRGGAPARVTAMAAPSEAPGILEAPVAQYRLRGRVFRARPDGYRPRAIVLHATGGGAPGSGFSTVRELHRFFARPAANAASHYAIGRDGTIARFVPDEEAAFHVATPGWNDISIGIELLNDNSGADPYPPAQLAAATRLVRWLGTRHGIPVEGVVRHRTVQPADRRDPVGFPWRAWLATLR